LSYCYASFMAYETRFTITPHILLKLLKQIASFREKIITATLQVSWISRPVFATLSLLGVFILGSGPVRGDEAWVTYQLPAVVSFSLSTPAVLQKLEGRDEWRATDEDGRLYGVGMGYYTEPRKITSPEPFMRMMINSLAANLKAQVAYSYFFKYQYAPACEFKLVDVANHQVAAGRYFLVHQWFYFLNYTTSDKTFDVKGMKRFFESFQMINPALKDFQPISE